MTTLAEPLVELQRIDTLTDQLRVQRERSPLRVEFSEATARMRSWEQRRDSIRARIAELESEVEADEQRGAELAAHLDRLERQLKTVIAPREAEALMHEIATFTTQRDDLDIRELEAMEEESTLESDSSDISPTRPRRGQHSHRPTLRSRPRWPTSTARSRRSLPVGGGGRVDPG